jgi:molybdopterin-dependent oxidoreductase alpha subunit
VKTGSPKRTAAGVTGVRVALQHAIREMGVIRSLRALGKVNKPDGFDCPGCAWPETSKVHIAEFCENGAKAVAEEASRKRANAAFFARHGVAELDSWTDFELGQAGRLTEPMLLDEGADHYRPVSWDEAFDVIVEELRALDSPDEASFYTSGRTSNEAAFLYQLLVRGFGTNNLPDCSNMCHESSSHALTQTIGIGKGSVTIDDVHEADLILVVGQNPGTNHPRMLTALEEAKRAGATIVAVNPLPEAGLMRFKNPQRVSGVIGHGTQLADEFVQIRLGGDLAFFQGVGRLLLDADALDHAFVAEHTDGFEALAAHLRALDWDAVDRATGVPRAQIERVAELMAGSERTIVCWAMGLTQQRDAVATIREIVNVLLLRGNIGRPGAGLCPVRGHSNVQGDRTMGITEQPTPQFLDRLAMTAGFAPPRAHGFDTVDAIRAMRDGRVHVFVSMGGNFAAATPDSEATHAALRAQRLTVQISTKLNRSHVVHGRRAVILPTLGRSEVDGGQHVSVEDSMGMIHASRGTLTPASPALRSEVAIVCGLARRLLGHRLPLRWESLATDYDAVRDLIEQTIDGFEDYNARLAEPGGFQLPHGPRDARRFATGSGRAELTVNALRWPEPPAGHLLLQTVRSHDQYNTTVYALNDRYRGVKAGRRVVLVHPDDLAAQGVADGDTVDIVSVDAAGVERRAERFRAVAYPTARGCAASYFPECNVLVALDATAETSNTPVSKAISVRLVTR